MLTPFAIAGAGEMDAAGIDAGLAALQMDSAVTRFGLHGGSSRQDLDAAQSTFGESAVSVKMVIVQLLLCVCCSWLSLASA